MTEDTENTESTNGESESSNSEHIGAEHSGSNGESEGSDPEDITVEFRFARTHPSTTQEVKDILIDRGLEIVIDPECPPNQVYFYSDPPFDQEEGEPAYFSSGFVDPSDPIDPDIVLTGTREYRDDDTEDDDDDDDAEDDRDDEDVEDEDSYAEDDDDDEQSDQSPRH